MGLLNRFFRSPEEVAKELALDEVQLAKAWQDYADSALEKGKLINALQPGTLKQILPQLKNAVVSELVKTAGEEKTEEQLLADLKAIEHEEHIKRVKRLEYTICYAETKHEYIHQLLKELWQILNTQLHIVEALIAGSKQEELLVQKLKESWKVEEHILKLISERETFHQLFAALLKGEHIVRQLTSQESKFVARAEKETGITNRMLSRWTHEIDARLHDKVGEWISSTYRENHPHSHFEFVNSPDFVPFAREVMQSLRKTERPVSESAINTFVHLFREWYNKKVNV
jgi:hypothetical protein